ncbi:MAG: twin-arginine translocase TatA/TatE family subunit [Actinomycetota bacterium]
MAGLGAGELLLILAVLLLLFGASKLPSLARSMGQASKEFKSGLKDGHKAEAEEAVVAGPCPFCATEVPLAAKFCPGCAKSSTDIALERSAQQAKAS